MEDGHPLIVFSQQINRDKSIAVYTCAEGHCTAPRGYLRTLHPPRTAAEIAAAWQAIGQYAKGARFSAINKLSSGG